ncbi:hypothetical protein ACH5RR_037977 [Cinchona calisaya]|uniref:Zinc finger PMZ-type domain-containing protein n=1 Tax=Cinchona calisaya TaxID=153742 RepID=A0ABD2Y926_9GENT
MSLEYEAIPASEGVWEVTNININHVVNLDSATYTYKKWDITGIPCFHACSAIIHMGKDVVNYVHQRYRVESYKKSYRHVIMPVPYQILWVQAKGDPIDLP